MVYAGGHECPKASCRWCKRVNCKNFFTELLEVGAGVTCSECNFYYKTPACFEAHVNICKLQARCGLCNHKTTPQKIQLHECQLQKCQTCGAVHDAFSQCFVQDATLARGVAMFIAKGMGLIVEGLDIKWGAEKMAVAWGLYKGGACKGTWGREEGAEEAVSVGGA